MPPPNTKQVPLELVGGVVHPHHLPIVIFFTPSSTKTHASFFQNHHIPPSLHPSHNKPIPTHSIKQFKWLTQQWTRVWFWWWLPCSAQELQLNPVAQMCWWACHRVSTISQGILQPHLQDAAHSLPVWYAPNHNAYARLLAVVDHHWVSTSTKLKHWPCLLLARFRPLPPVSVTMVSRTTIPISLHRTQKRKQKEDSLVKHVSNWVWILRQRDTILTPAMTWHSMVYGGNE